MIQIGDLINGGIVFHVDASGEHGLVASNSYIGNATFGCINQLIDDTEEGIADYPLAPIGLSNSNFIASRCAENGTAAKICLSYSVDGYSDWFLPSKDELNLMYLNIKEQMVANYHWSSTEYNKRFAWQQHFASGTQYKIYKNINAYVRAVRAF
jgi:hypothetical protein